MIYQFIETSMRFTGITQSNPRQSLIVDLIRLRVIIKECLLRLGRAYCCFVKVENCLFFIT